MASLAFWWVVLAGSPSCLGVSVRELFSSLTDGRQHLDELPDDVGATCVRDPILELLTPIARVNQLNLH
jgi:hypothetical protein